ncbi:MAG TPA: S8 family serine peptidase [Candidatus Baltobacteraceae bacterium]
MFLITILAGCGGAGMRAVPPGSRAASSAAAPADAPATLPGDAQGLPGDAPATLPGDAPATLPGDAPATLPGNIVSLCPEAPAGSARCLALQNTGIAPVSDPHATPLEIHGLQPADLTGAYELPGATSAAGTGQTVAIVDAYDDPAAEADLAIYRAAFGLPECSTANGCFRRVDQAGSLGPYPAPNRQWATEIALDLDVLSATCPNCHILLVEANSASLDDLGASVDRAVAMGANVVSNSYDAFEWSGEAAEESHYRHAGVPITVSSGDRGVPMYPAASRYVTSVGGTTLTRAGGSWTETAWQSGGHGCSYYLWRPYWQPPGPCHNARSTVDVAAVADPQTGVAVYDDFTNSGQAGGWIVVGGTSVGAPLVAAAYALAGNGRAINSAWYLYAHRSAFNDVAPAGFDAYTGLGTPHGLGGL